MSEWLLLSASMYLADSILSGVYAQRFLGGKYSKRTVLAAWGAAYFLVQVVLFEIFGSRFSAGRLAGILLNTGTLLSLQSVLFTKEMQKQLFVTFSFLAGKQTVRYIVSVISITLSGVSGRILDRIVAGGTIDMVEKAQAGIRICNTVVIVICALSYVLLLSVYLFLISRKFMNKGYPLRTQENVFLLLPCVVALCVSVLVRMIVTSVEEGMTVIIYDTIPATRLWIPVICALLSAAVVASVVLVQKLVQSNQEAGRCAMLENQVRQMQKEIAEIQDIYADMRGLRHDMRSHLSGIALFVRESAGLESEELAGYIGKMEETVSRLDFTCQTGNPITDVIIHQKSQEAEKRQIPFQADFVYPARLSIDVYDIAVILNNALENAMEACGRVAGARQVRLNSYVKGSLFFIEVENDFTGDIVIDRESGLPVSGKENDGLHGIGISNIRRCAEKYMGDIDIVVSGADGRKKFCLTVMMNGAPAR